MASKTLKNSKSCHPISCVLLVIKYTLILPVKGVRCTLFSTLFLLVLPSRLPNPSSRALPHLLHEGSPSAPPLCRSRVQGGVSEHRQRRHWHPQAHANPCHPSTVGDIHSWRSRPLAQAPGLRLRRTRLVVKATSVPAMDGASESEYLSALNGSAAGGTETGDSGTLLYCSVAEQIEKSKSHWSLLAESDASDEGDHEEAEVRNVRVFQALQSKWGGYFFCPFNDGRGSILEVGEKFAEGGQAELFHAKVRWGNPVKNELNAKEGREWVLKVFKKGTSLRSLQTQWPQGLLHFLAEEAENWKSPTPTRPPRFYSNVCCGTLMDDGRFAFLIEKEHFDLRNLIERSMELRKGKDGGPFSTEAAEFMMYEVALGLQWLHRRDIVHRDFKAANVLVYKRNIGYLKWACCVADYECSIGVVGTAFFRAPEILQACKERKISQRPEVFSKAADVYAFGMTCYEILTGKLPFAGHAYSDYDLVLNGQRPILPQHVEGWKRQLLGKCWESNPLARPAVGEILRLFSANSEIISEYEKALKGIHGDNFIIEHSVTEN